MNGALRNTLEEMINRLVAAVHPVAIYLFGSQADGTATEDSDIDLMVVVPDGEEPLWQVKHRAWRSMSGIPVPKDLVIEPLSRFRRRGTVYASMECEILESGVLLYG
ncbi:MAG: nucleotidyltransferase domain-containing protein [Candidatus Sumerlaeota bacterium]|nr:nucleotidyltransferase domain-containing protein [Candidatus Sumerlaeota bacterium]